ncbi:MAG: CidA/LrgA family protein [Sphaerochaetaceae bacterium]|nr:CidA/LrgA family protein [Sphaerochaetaceae bacterium]
MKYLLQFCIILVISFVSEVCHSIIPLPIPSSIYGIVILFVLLKSGLLAQHQVEATGKFLIELMPVMFIPAAVGLMQSWEAIRNSLVSYLVVILVSTLLVMGVSGHVTQAFLKGKRHVVVRRSWKGNDVV